ncbi:MAG: MacB family efflux pump subunit [Steroidobacteraceae bacterium]
MDAPLLRLAKVRRDFPAGEETITVLRDVDLEIRAGEFIAIVGASGSGKSTLMNILGCLDRPTSGSYQVAGRETSEMQPDELAELRREHFGFIFQRYHLLGDLTATANAEVPAIYAGRGHGERRSRARELLTKLGLSHRLDYRPSQLSGGQQQRVSIARALINGGEVILADEPTGALDTTSGAEVLRILDELNREGQTIVLVTHDMSVAQHAHRIIEISDGVITADRRVREPAAPPSGRGRAAPAGIDDLPHLVLERFLEAFRMAIVAMRAHRTRTFLTMLGIIIGIASVVSVVALGTGAQQQILSNLSQLGTNTLNIFPGKGFGDMRSGAVQTLTIGDVNALAGFPYVDSVTPSVSTSATIRFRDAAATGEINGVGSGYFRARGMQLNSGRLFDASADHEIGQVAVIDENTVTTLFKDRGDPIGQVILLGSMPARVIGVLKKNSREFGGGSSLRIYAPYSTVTARMLGSSRLQNISVRVPDGVSSDLAEQAITRFLTVRHGTKDFFIGNSNDFVAAVKSSTQTMTLLVSSIALISLIVGGIGVMNIMLVSVTERTREIGVRMAVGARQGDILQQFLIEAVLVCLVGGVIGVGIALGLAALVAHVAQDFRMVISPTSIIVAFLCSSAIGVAFGFLPARSAARLDPVESLARD